MLKVALTGNIGSGKSTVIHFFELLGIPVFSADASGHAALNHPKAVKSLREIFGQDIFDEKGFPIRKKLADIVFSDHRKLQQLNAITHPIIKEGIAFWMQNQEKKAPYLLCEVAVLFEAHFETFFDKIITISAPEYIRAQRVIERDGWKKEQIEQRIRSQFSEEIKIQKSDFCIFNDGTQAIIPQILSIDKQLRKSVKEK